MIKVQLLLLLGLVGPFCAVARASTLVTPLDWVSDTTAATNTLKEDGATNTSTSEPKTAVAEVVTKAPATEKPFTTQADEAAPKMTEATPTETVATEAAEQEATTTESPAVTPAYSEATAAAETEEELVVEEEGTSSGQVVGIVIGALVAVIVVIAVVIALVRRMGKYSP